MKSCSFFGHRQIEETEVLKNRLSSIIETLIKEKGVERFLFGSRSQFDSLCHSVVTELKEKYPNIVRVAYNTKSECVTLEKDRIETEQSWEMILHKEVHLKGFEESITPDCVYVSGKASYIERNQSMVDASDYCVFYYDESFVPPVKQLSKRYYMPSSQNSGTATIYKYAIGKKKEIINVYVKTQN